jgi:putative ABC transport system permease protein|tara:strand:+ start:4485 stop:4649 length:165 start_codon:yes stop_codon:yes gene_type:complete
MDTLMFLALRDLAFAKGRFLLMATVIIMVALMMVLLTGLSIGLVDCNISGIRAR